MDFDTAVDKAISPGVKETLVFNFPNGFPGFTRAQSMTSEHCANECAHVADVHILK